MNSFKYAYNYVYYVEVPAGIFKKGDMGCIGHWNYKGQRKMADSIYEAVKHILEHWFMNIKFIYVIKYQPHTQSSISSSIFNNHIEIGLFQAFYLHSYAVYTSIS